MRYPNDKPIPSLASAPREARLAHEAERLRDGDIGAVAAQAGRLLSALETGNAGRARDLLEVSVRANRLPAVLAADCGGRRPLRELAEAWRTRGLSPLAGDDAAATDGLARALVGAAAAGGDVAGAAALLACMAGRAGPALLAEDALAVRLGAGQPAMLTTLLGALPADARARALASGRGEIFTALLERRDADDLLADLLGHIVAQGDSAVAAGLLRESRNLLFTAARGRRLEGALTPLLALSGPDFRAAIDGHRAALRRFGGPAAADATA